MSGARLPRIPLVHGPTPIHRAEALGRELGVDLWIKRDDATGGAESGNKLRKLEFLLGEAKAQKKTIVLTCGGTQSNHARATAIACARVGLKSVLLLRRGDLADTPHPVGNVLLDRLVGAEVRFIDRSDWPKRNDLLAAAARELEGWGERAYVIPEGGSNGLGALGYVEAMRETRAQMDLGLAPNFFNVIVHACGSGGTAAGVVLGAASYRVAASVRPIAVCDDAATFQAIIERVMADAQTIDRTLVTAADLVVDDHSKGPAYGVMDADQLAFLVHVARSSGLVLDPTYTGKAMMGLKSAIARGEIRRDSRVLFLHTGGLPGLLAQSAALEGALGTSPS